MANWFLVLILCVNFCYGAKILVVFPVPAGSHNNLGMGIVRNLLKAGHEQQMLKHLFRIITMIGCNATLIALGTGLSLLLLGRPGAYSTTLLNNTMWVVIHVIKVTYITPFAPKSNLPNLRYVVADSAIDAIPAESLRIEAIMTGEVVFNPATVFDMMYNVTTKMLHDEKVQKLMNDPREHFDLVIVERMFLDVTSGFSVVFDCPFIWSFPYEPNFDALSLIDEATNPAYTTNVAFSYVPPFTFQERVEMLWFQIVETASNIFHYRVIENKLYEEVFTPILERRGRVLPPYDDVRLNASMMLGNTHASFGTTIRLPQNFKAIGGYHIDPVIEPLPDDLKQILDNSKNGVIYFSMGSNLKSKDFPTKVKSNLLEMFGTLTQTVIWKFEETFPKIPNNVHILKWAPQPSILAHPNCVLFITHGGLLSTTEAVHFGVPIIGMPVFFDQFNNIERAAKKGFGKKVLLSYNLADDLKEAIDDVLGNPKYKQTMKELYFIYHNRPISPGQELVHWVEHTIATRGAVYLRSPALHVPIYQKFYLDLLAIIALVVYAIKRFISFQVFTSKRNRVPKKKRS